MPRLGLGLGLTMGNILGVSLASTLADLYVARVATIPDFVVPSYARVVAGYEALINAYAVGTKAALETATAMFADPSVSGYVPGAGTLITAGAACARVGNMAWFDDNSRDLVQTTPLNQPLLLTHTGANYVWLPGVTGNGFSTPDNVGNQLSTNFGIEAKIKPSILSALNTVAAKYGSSEAEGNYFFRLESTNKLQLAIYFGGNASIYSSTVNYPHAVNVQSFVRVSRNSTTGNVMFFTSLNGITYTQLGTTVAGATGAIDYDAVPLRIGAIATSLAQVFSGAIEYVKLFKDDTFTTATQFFDPTSYNASVSQTTFTVSTGEVYTLNVGTESTGYKLAMVDRTIMQFNGIASFLAASSVNRTNVLSQYLVFKTSIASNSGLSFVDSASANYQNSITPEGVNIKLYMNGSANGLALAFTNNTLFLITAKNAQGVLNSLQIKNGTAATNTYTPALSGNGIQIGKMSGAFFQQGNMNTYISANQFDSAPVATAIYNYLKTINAGI